MLEIKNLTKIYKTKNAKDVRALDGVSLVFNTTGMVFLLGKSGSGKSTLLNVIGGLDSFDSGDIVIKGKSARDFKQKDFDSYRNTYVGFVFQEYNVLSEFTVHKNIALALELQGKKTNKESVDSLLEQVDLLGYAKRLPNQLSGGQKQRIAIARALIKNPEIIMADEPTGALDSATGKQVLETLKKLSETKLVIVVSHDREFAEQYGDRIIELKDGKVIADVTKRKTPPSEISQGFKALGNNMFQVEKGHKLSAKEIEMIQKAAESSDSDIVISANEKLNPELKKTAGIDEHGNSEYFNETQQDDIEPSEKKDNLSLIKSKLKFKDSFKMGASGLKTKKVRLFFTILLSAIALTLFGFADTMASFNVKRCNYESLTNLGYTSINITKNHAELYGDYVSRTQVNVSKDDYNYLTQTFPDYEFIKIYETNSFDFEYYTKKSIENYFYYIRQPSGITSVTKEQIDSFGATIASGHLPENKNEIMITSYQLSIFNEYGYSDGSLAIDAGNVTKDNILNKEFFDYKIVGVLETNFDDSAYTQLKNIGSQLSPTLDVYSKMLSFTADLANGLHNLILMHESAIVKDAVNIESVYRYDSYAGWQNNYTNHYSIDGDKILDGVVFFDPNKTTLEKNEVIIGQDVYYPGGNPYFSASIKYDGKYCLSYADPNKSYDTVEKFKAAVREVYLTTDEAQSENVEDFTLPLLIFDYSNEIEYNDYKVVGIYYDFLQYPDGVTEENEQLSIYGENTIFFKDSACAPSFISVYFGEYLSLLTKLSGNASKDRELIYELSGYDSNVDTLVIKSSISDTLQTFVEMIQILAKVFLYVGIGFAVFAGLLLMNFIAVSISYKKKEIGILRALGAKGSDVYGIFLNESFIISAINYVVAVVFTLIAVLGFNNIMTSELGINLTLMSFGIRQILLMLAISLLVAVVASFLPTFRISRMKPIDAIQERK